MKKLSNFQITLLVVFGSLFAAGVLIFALATAGGNSKAIAPVTMWGTFDDTLVALVMQQAIDADKRLEQVTYVRKDPATYERDLTEALAEGGGPDMFILRGDYALHDSGKAMHIPYSSFPQAQFQSAFLDAASSYLADDGIIAVPLVVDPLVLFWNRDMLATAGYANPPAFWDEVAPMVRKMTKRDDGGSIIKSGVALGEHRNIHNAKDILSTLILQAGGTITGHDSRGVLVSTISPQGSTLAAASQNALGFYTQFADPANDAYAWSRALPESQTSFAAGDVGLYVGHASEAANIAKTNPNLNLAMAPLPQIRAMDRTLDTALVYGIAIARTSRHQTDALTAAYLIAKQPVSLALAEQSGMASALRSAVSLPAQGNADLVNKAAIISRAWLDPDPVATEDLFRAMIEDTVSGSSKIIDAVSQADKLMKQIIGEGEGT
ncbi:extracellular solute-binding protein [Candidatus Kaiserbacteria bacterium]|nr:extracellular solute-binding protein [Candidatus Kaiserbacteria bacterium]